MNHQFRELAAGIFQLNGFFPDNVCAIQTTREGGVSCDDYADFNLAEHVGDDPRAVSANRTRLSEVLGAQCVWLNQVHGIHAVEVDLPGGAGPADAAFTDRENLALAVMTADCLPVLLSTSEGETLGCAHAGWRGLCDGVLEALLSAMQNKNGQALCEGCHVWLGPAIGPSAFEVGEEVRERFVAVHPGSDRFFIAHVANPGKWFADLQGIARFRIENWCDANNIKNLRIEAYGGCVYAQSETFYSYRRERKTGRMASLILRKPI